MIKNYLEKCSVLALAGLITKSINMLAMAFVANYVSVQEYGLLGNLEAFSRIVFFVMSLYLPSALSVYLYKDYAISTLAANRLYSTHMLFAIAWPIAIILVFFTISNLVGLESFYIPLSIILIILVTEQVNQVTLINAAVLRAQLEINKIAVIQIVACLVGVSVTLLFLILFDSGIYARLYGILATTFCQFLFLFGFVAQKFKLFIGFDSWRFKRSVKYSLPLLPMAAASWILLFTDRIMLSHFGMLEGVGLLTLASQFGLVLLLITTALTEVHTPIVMKALNSNIDAAIAEIQFFFKWYTAVFLFFYLCFAFLVSDVIRIMFPLEYSASSELSLIIALSFFFGGLYRVFGNIVSFFEKPIVFTLATFMQLFANILLNFMFIPYYGEFAASLTTLFVTIIYLCVIFYASQRCLRISLSWGFVIKHFLGTGFIILTFGGFNYFFDTGVLFYLLKYTMLAIFGYFFIKFYIFHFQEEKNDSL